jgi:leucyl-tRNA synthetase
VFDEAMLRDEEIEVPVQLMGKVRHRIMVPSDVTPKQLEELALGDDKVKELIAGKTVRKIIVVPGKLVNIVAS